ncbi:MAG TPA: hypothetical protein VHD90_22370 [Phototrophicaceae bacterium]|nr:hypothetical protein [Phototrophicaceae bacterium]
MMAESVEVTLQLPADLVRDARELNLFSDSSIAQLLQTAVDQRVNEIVNEEIHAYRRDKRAKQNP